MNSHLTAIKAKNFEKSRHGSISSRKWPQRPKAGYPPRHYAYASQAAWQPNKIKPRIIDKTINNRIIRSAYELYGLVVEVDPVASFNDSDVNDFDKNLLQKRSIKPGRLAPLAASAALRPSGHPDPDRGDVASPPATLSIVPPRFSERSGSESRGGQVFAAMISAAAETVKPLNREPWPTLGQAV